MRKDLTRLMSPKSVAFLGGGWADRVNGNCRYLGFQGPIFRIHPEKAAAGVEGHIFEFEINPIIIRAQGLGAIAVDCLVRLKGEE